MGMKKDYQKKIDSDLKQLAGIHPDKSEVELLRVKLANLYEKIDAEEKELKNRLGYLLKACKSKAEEKWLGQRYQDYKNGFDFMDSDESDLINLLYFELRIKQLQELAQKEKKGSGILKDIHKEMREANSQLLDLKTKMSLTKSQRTKETDNAVTMWEDLLDSAEKFIDEHKNEFTWKCKCGQINVLEMPHFALDPDDQTIPWSEEGILLVQEGKLALGDLAKVLRTSEFGLKKIAQKKGVKLDNKEKANES